jgi:hypothetical protein
VALLERTESGTYASLFADSSGDLELIVDDVKKSATTPLHLSLLFGGPLDNAERKPNFKWLKQHFRSLNDVGNCPFNNADLWQLHQYYFRPRTRT